MRVITQEPYKADCLAFGPQPQHQDGAELHGIRAGLLIPGRGEPIKNAAVIIHGGKIAWVGLRSALPNKYNTITFTEVPVIMPGLWDCHVHFSGQPPYEGVISKQAFPPAALAGARIVRGLERTLLAGFTSVRELGGYAGEVSPAVEEGTIIGPNIYSSIAPISMTAGHGDLHDQPLATVLDACAHGFPLAVCDGVADCIKTVRLMIRRGAKVIKVCATGGVVSILDDPEDSQFSPEELKAMVDEAARGSRVVAAHCHGKNGIMAALDAGVKTIEHGSYLDEEAIALMKKKGAILVATRLGIEAGLEAKDLWPPYSYTKLVKIASHHKRAYALAVKSGVKIALGTDWEPGQKGKELYYAVEAGMTPLEAIEACTATSPETLGQHMAPKSGQLREGYDADIIAMSHSPLEDIKLLSDETNITHVWKGGKLFKSP